jgi:hypothetical protein
MSCVKSDTFPIGRDSPNNPFVNKANPYTWNQFYIPIQVKAVNGTWMPFKAKIDSGADVTTLNKATADALGFKASMGRAAVIQGINSTSTSTINMRADIKIGKLAPVNTEININQDGQLPNNILGNQDLLTSGRFEYRLTKNQMTVFDLQANCPVPATKAKAVFATVLYDDDNPTITDYYF